MATPVTLTATLRGRWTLVDDARSTQASWDPDTYEAFTRHRHRPFADLVARVDRPGARLVVDAGCGTGRTTVDLARRFPEARVMGVDASAEMLAQATGRSDPPRITFERADIRAWQPPKPADVVVANAVLHIPPEPRESVRHVADWVGNDGTFAFQVPANFDSPASRAVAEVASDPRWRERLDGVSAPDNILTLDEYSTILESEGYDVHAWETEYRMRLPGPDGVLRFMEGTALRPYVAALGDESEPWLRELGKRLRDAYPDDRDHVVFPFRRRFVVATRTWRE